LRACPSSKRKIWIRALRSIRTPIQFKEWQIDYMMRKLLQAFPILLIVAGLVLLSEKPACAYTDPGTGLLAIQAAGSALVAAGWYLRRKIFALLHRGPAAKPPQDEYSALKQDESSSLQ
jgi:hypothetical protein